MLRFLNKLYVFRCIYTHTHTDNRADNHNKKSDGNTQRKFYSDELTGKSRKAEFTYLIQDRIMIYRGNITSFSVSGCFILGCLYHFDSLMYRKKDALGGKESN